jgi:hypothetical protein
MGGNNIPEIHRLQYTISCIYDKHLLEINKGEKSDQQNNFPLQKLLHSLTHRVNLLPVGVTSAFRRPQDTLSPSRH